MECPVCYSSAASCNLVCGHAFCNDCVKEWYNKSDEQNCPMCRKGMYFKGMYKVRKEWDKEARDAHIQEIYAGAVNDIIEEFEDEPDFIIDEIYNIECLIRNTRDDYSLDDIDYWVNDPDGYFESILLMCRSEHKRYWYVHEPCTFTRYLFVNQNTQPLMSLSGTHPEQRSFTVHVVF